MSSLLFLDNEAYYIGKRRKKKNGEKSRKNMDNDSIAIDEYGFDGEYVNWKDKQNSSNL